MRPVLFSVFGFDIQSYGVSKALAALVAAFLLARAFDRLALKRDFAYSLVMWATIWGFVGAKIYYLLEQLPNFDLHHLGGMGFTWYGGSRGDPHHWHPAAEPSTTKTSRGAGRWPGGDRSVGGSGDRTVDPLTAAELVAVTGVLQERSNPDQQQEGQGQ